MSDALYNLGTSAHGDAPAEIIHRSAAAGGNSSGSFDRKDWLRAALLFLAVLVTYQPAWHGGMLWDDDHHVPSSEFQSWEGLRRIWFEPKAIRQYYPVTHSVFWLAHRAWGDDTLGYHLANIALHSLAAILLVRVLRQLRIPGAWLAAALFALHPVQVESVAWITEMKNTLSGVFYLASASCYLSFDRTRSKLPYVAAVGFFLLAVLSKTVTATLPAAVLVVLWWRGGRLSWRHDVLPLLPLWILAIAVGVFSALMEQQEVSAMGGYEYQFTWVERFLIAGRATWFYLYKLFWPVDLIFIYPRWQVSQAAAWQYVFPLAAVAVLAALWRLAKRGPGTLFARAPLAAALFFGGTLFPALGFLNVFPFRYSLVADHFQYLACVGMIALTSAGAALVLRRGTPRGRTAGRAACVGMIGVLAVLSWRQAHAYVDCETLYRTILRRNPDCWMAHNNLGILLQQSGRVSEAVGHHQEAIRLYPGCIEAYNNLGNALASLGRSPEAAGQFEEALRRKPDYAEAHYNLAGQLDAMGQHGPAIAHYEEALRINPERAEAHYNLGNMLLHAGRLPEAVERFRQAIRWKPDYAEAHHNLGHALSFLGRPGEAIEEFQEAVRLKPDHAQAHNSLGAALVSTGHVGEAIDQYEEALRLQPGYLEAHVNLGLALAMAGRTSEAVERYEQALRQAESAGRWQLAEAIRQRLQSYPDAPRNRKN